LQEFSIVYSEKMFVLAKSLMRKQRRCASLSLSLSTPVFHSNIHSSNERQLESISESFCSFSSDASNTHCPTNVAKMRIVAINDVYQLENLPKFHDFLLSLHERSSSELKPHPPDAIVLAGDFVSPSTLSSIDSGKGAIATLKAVGISHACLGNHEADLKLEVLKERISEFSMLGSSHDERKAKEEAEEERQGKGTIVINTNMRHEKNSTNDESTSWLCDSSLIPPYSIVTTPCQTVKIALLGLMSDEPTMFHDGAFRGIPISNVLTTYEEYYQKLVVEQKLVDFVVPLTHQSLKRDVELANFILQNNGDEKSIIIGGHEHHPIDKLVADQERDKKKESSSSFDSNQHAVRILKSGCDAQYASLIDLEFDISSKPYRTIKITSRLVDMATYANSPRIQKIVDKHMSVITKLEDEIIIDESTYRNDENMEVFGGSSLMSSSDLDSKNTCLSSKGTRLQQTSMGGFMCQAIKDELEVDACIINGATIKGHTTYDDNRVSYAQLKQELPFPTKMVVVPMARHELMDAIEYSRNYGEAAADGDFDGHNATNVIPRKGYLQTDFDLHSEIVEKEYYYKDSADILTIALPRNLLNGFCNIQPLVELGDRLKETNQFPDKDDYMPALDIVLRYACKAKWREIARMMQQNDASGGDKESAMISFDDLDLNKDGVLDRYEIKTLMTQLLGYEPSDFAVDDMIAAIDDDKNGTIDRGEFSYLLATMERERNL